MGEEGRLTRDLRTQEITQWRVPVVSFCLIHLRFGAKETVNPETQMGTD